MSMFFEFLHDDTCFLLCGSHPREPKSDKPIAGGDGGERPQSLAGSVYIVDRFYINSMFSRLCKRS